MKAWNDNWKNPCILEHLLSDDRKAQKTMEVLDVLGFVIEPYNGYTWFDIVRKG